ncbi:hypothetical protein QYF36_024939 [Acer negundo]|nr:hypothetical protein QYF36_024939 [Acer negundo]
MPTFCNLKHLDLEVGGKDGDVVDIMACLLQYSHGLQSLHLSIRGFMGPFALLSQSKSSPPPRMASSNNESSTVSSKAPSLKPPFVEPSRQHNSRFN